MPRRRLLSQRRLFTGLMTGLSTLFGVGLMAVRYGDQTDSLTDRVKIAGFMAACCLVIAYTVWTWLHHRSRHTPLRGAVAGGLTALCLIPLPFFASTFKDGFFAAYKSGEAGLLDAIFRAIPPAIETGYLTFIYLTKASLIAIILSAALGYAISRWGPPAGTSPRQR
ncbi:MAG: hypothetical protein ACSHX3_09415 [Litorimonas sp.]